jgi:protein-S-isoprenylcysteine O-methyltransferase Ste14
MRFVPPDYLFVFVVLQLLLHYLFPVFVVVSYPYVYLGVILILFGLYLNIIWVTKIFRKNKTTVRPEEIPTTLVTSGFFRYSRNPTYLGMALTLFGVSVLIGSLITFIFPLLFIVLTGLFTIPIEEKNLEKKFGKKYLNYKKEVRRWI